MFQNTSVFERTFWLGMVAVLLGLVGAFIWVNASPATATPRAGCPDGWQLMSAIRSETNSTDAVTVYTCQRRFKES